MKIKLVKKYLTFIPAITLFSCVNNNPVEIPIDYYKRNNIKLFMSENDVKKMKKISKDDYVNAKGYQIYYQRDTIGATVIDNGFYCKNSKLVIMVSFLRSPEYNLILSDSDLKNYNKSGDTLFTMQNENYSARIELQKIYQWKELHFYITVKSKKDFPD